MTEHKRPDEASSETKTPAQRPPGLPTVDVAERAGRAGGDQQVMNRRLFMQLLVFEVDGETAPALSGLRGKLEAAGVGAVIYEDVNHPRGLGLLTWSDDPAHFVKRVRPVIGEVPALRSRPEFTMIGRTYATGHEPDLAFTLLERPKNNVLSPAWPWAVWYPLRRSGAFNKLDAHEQAMILREHASIGMAYGQQDLAHDVRLACFGMDAKDNEFVVGLIASELHPISHCVQAMRKTRQTSEYIVQMGPFFVGYAAWQSAGK
jgi:chlorite dismutase